MSVFFQVAVNDRPHHALVRFCSFPDGGRFEQKQDALGRVLVCVVLSTDLMDDVVAECHIPECPSWSGCCQTFVLQYLLDVLGNLEVGRFGPSIDKVGPIEVAARCPFSSSERTEYNKTRVWGCILSDLS